MVDNEADGGAQRKQTHQLIFEVVFRSQLARKNDFYAFEPPPMRDATSELTEDCKTGSCPCAEQYQSLCMVCGNPGNKQCSRCKKASYCSKADQLIDWKRFHKAECQEDRTELGPRDYSDLLLPELELVIEPESPTVQKPQQNHEEKSETEKLKEYQTFLKSEKASSLMKEGAAMKHLESMATADSDIDKQFKVFKKRIQNDPEQVLRYQLGGQPLWVSSYNQPKSEDIPPCTCGAPRQFEFQVMPQLLCHLKLDSLEQSLDWGMLGVYTCANSCDIGNKYIEEFLWKQDYAKTE